MGLALHGLGDVLIQLLNHLKVAEPVLLLQELLLVGELILVSLKKRAVRSDNLFLFPNLHGGVAGYIRAEDVPDEAGHDHPCGGAPLPHLAVEHARRVGVSPL